jgi:hypothetical protein
MQGKHAHASCHPHPASPITKGEGKDWRAVTALGQSPFSYREGSKSNQQPWMLAPSPLVGEGRGEGGVANVRHVIRESAGFANSTQPHKEESPRHSMYPAQLFSKETLVRQLSDWMFPD